jgi:CDP-diacylglycerol--glycerol-3-phosphate 3-phosphatidyltransferase
MTDDTKSRLRVLQQPLVRLLLALRVGPLAVTIAGLILSIACAALLSQGWFISAGIVLLLAGLCDTLDGELARRAQQVSRTGAFLDSSFDRISEFAVFFGLFWYFRAAPRDASLIFAAFFASLAVSYVRARAEGIGVECKVGLFERPVRFLFLVIAVFGAHFSPLVPRIALVVILLGASVTVVQRMVHVLRASAK